MQLMTRTGEPNEVDLESLPVGLPDGSQRNSIDQAIADLFVSNVKVDELEGWPKFKFKVKHLCTRWFLAAIFALVASVFVNIKEDEEGEVFDENIKWPYYISHFILGLSFYLLLAISYNICVIFFDLDGQWVAALSGSILWYLSREVRDREKLGFWDWEGLYAPTLGLVYVFILFQCLAMWWRYKITREDKYVSRYAMFMLTAMFIGNTVVSIIVNKYFRGPFGSKSDDE